MRQAYNLCWILKYACAVQPGTTWGSQCCHRPVLSLACSPVPCRVISLVCNSSAPSIYLTALHWQVTDYCRSDDIVLHPSCTVNTVILACNLSTQIRSVCSGYVNFVTFFLISQLVIQFFSVSIQNCTLASSSLLLSVSRASPLGS